MMRARWVWVRGITIVAGTLLSTTLVFGSPGGRSGSAPSADGGAPVASPLNLLAPVIPPANAAPAQSYELVRAKDGSGDLTFEATAFGARIRRDGTVSFHDKHVSVMSFIPWWPAPTPTGVPTLEGAIRGVLAKRTQPSPSSFQSSPSMNPPASPPAAGRSGSLVPGMSPFHADPREVCVYPRPCFFDAGVLLVGVSGQFDLTDEVLRLAGHDPYRYQKAQFLVGTRELRVRMAARTHAEDLAHAVAETPRRLETIARDTRLTVIERRQILQALRDEMDATTPEGTVNRARIQRLLDERLR